MKKPVFTILLFVTLAFLVGCSQEQAPASAPVPPTAPTPAQGAFLDLSPVEAKAVIDANPDLIIIDVSPHYDEGHLPGAVHYFLGWGDLDRAIPTLDKSKKYLVYCRSENSSIQAAQRLVDAGFENVYRLKGSYSAWVDAGFPIEK